MIIYKKQIFKLKNIYNKINKNSAYRNDEIAIIKLMLKLFYFILYFLLNNYFSCF